MTDIEIAPAIPADLSDILELARGTFDTHRVSNPRAFPDSLFGKVEQAHQNGVLAEIETHSTFVAKRAGAFLGCVLLKSCGPYGMIYDIGVQNDYQRTGIGAALLSHAIGHARKQDWEILIASVWDGNQASHNLFQSLGFVPQKSLSDKLDRLFPKRRNTTYSLKLADG